MAKQKYDNGSTVFAISYKKYYLVKVKLVVFKPEIKLYQVTFKNSDGTKDLNADLPEEQLISAAELTKAELAYNVQGIPEGYQSKQTGIYIFNTPEGFHIGSINFDGMWKDYKSSNFYDEVSHYLRIADFTEPDAEEEEDIMAYEMTILSEPPKDKKD